MKINLKSLFIAEQREIATFLRHRIGASPDVADLSQETFIRVARMQSSEAVENPRGFLFTIAANLARDHLRRALKREHSETETVDETLACHQDNPEEALCNQQQEGILRQAVDSLPAKSREIFLLYHIEGRSYREIAEVMELSPRTVEYHLRQALTFCREYARRADTA